RSKHYSGRGKASTSRAAERLRQICAGAHRSRLGYSSGGPCASFFTRASSIRFWRGGTFLARAEDIGDNMEVLVELHTRAQGSSRLTPAAQQAGQLHEAQILKVHDIAAFRRWERFGFRD